MVSLEDIVSKSTISFIPISINLQKIFKQYRDYMEFKNENPYNQFNLNQSLFKTYPMP